MENERKNNAEMYGRIGRRRAEGPHLLELTLEK